jgi:hypothetical protein
LVLGIPSDDWILFRQAETCHLVVAPTKSLHDLNDRTTLPLQLLPLAVAGLLLDLKRLPSLSLESEAIVFARRFWGIVDVVVITTIVACCGLGSFSISSRTTS